MIQVLNKNRIPLTSRISKINTPLAILLLPIPPSMRQFIELYFVIVIGSCFSDPLKSLLFRLACGCCPHMLPLPYIIPQTDYS